MKSFTAFMEEVQRLNYTVTSTFGAGYFYAGLNAEFNDTSFFNSLSKRRFMAREQTAEFPNSLSFPAITGGFT